MWGRFQGRLHGLSAAVQRPTGEFEHRINGRYPGRLPLSTVPPNVLAALPRLPDDLQYRFVGRHLVLLDAGAV